MGKSQTFNCDQCQRVFKRASALKVHRYVHQRHKHRCPVCSKEYLHAEQLRLHRCSHAAPRLLVCNECGKTLVSKEQLTAHRRAHAAERTYDCRVCGRSFSSFSNLNRHQNIHRDPEQNQDLNRSEKQNQDLHENPDQNLDLDCSPSPQNQLQHQDPAQDSDRSSSQTQDQEGVQTPPVRGFLGKAAAPQTFKCDQCGRAFKNMQSLKLHMFVHRKQKHRCPSCPKEFLYAVQLWRHRSSHHPTDADERTYDCRVCGRGFSSFSNLNRHQNLHRDLKPNQDLSECPEPNQDLQQDLKANKNVNGNPRQNQDSQRSSHSPRDQLQNQDPDRSHSQTQNQLLVQQRRRREVSGETFPDETQSEQNVKITKGTKTMLRKDRICCRKCGETFPGPKQFSTHLQLPNSLCQSKDLSFKCGQCDLICFAEKSLQKHRKLHSAARPYVCDVCGWRFEMAKTLKFHQARHQEERPFECDQCGRRYAMMARLKEHKLKHLEIKPHICSECGQGFIRPHLLREHQLKKHLETYRRQQRRQREQTGQSHGGEEEREKKPRLTPEQLSIERQQYVHRKGFECSRCGRSFRKKKRLLVHSCAYSEEGPGRHRCGEDRCGRSFSTAAELRRHRQFHSKAEGSSQTTGFRGFSQRNDGEQPRTEPSSPDSAPLSDLHEERFSSELREERFSSELREERFSSELREERFSCRECGVELRLKRTALTNVFSVTDFAHVRCFMENHTLL